MFGLWPSFTRYFPDSQLLLVARGSVDDSAYRISVGVESLDPRMTLRMDLQAVSILVRLDLLALP